MDDSQTPECQNFIVHESVVRNVQNTTPPTQQLYAMADIFKVIGDPTRMKIIYALFISEMCVCDISTLIGTTQSAVSHQLKVLRQSRLVTFRREGKTVFYSLSDEHVRKLIEIAKEHIEEG